MVETLPNYIDMSMTPAERAEDMPMMGGDQPIYPYGLCISMDCEQLERLDLEDDCEIGDLIKLNCLARVTSVSKRETTGGSNTRVELQIIGIEAEGEEEPMPKLGKSPY